MAFEAVSVEKVREYWNSRPCNIRHSMQPIGSKEYFDEVEARKYFVEPHIPLFAQFRRWKGKKVLEIGCGIGTDTINFAREGAEVTVVELSEKSIEVAQQRAEVFGLADRIRSSTAATRRSFRASCPIEPHDLVYSFGVIHHSPHPERILDEVTKYLMPGGTLKVMVYNRWSWKVIWIVMKQGKGRFWTLARARRRALGSAVRQPRHVHVLALRAEGEPRAPRIPRHRDLRRPHLPVAHPRLRPVPLCEGLVLPLPAEPAFRWLERKLGWHLCATAIYEP